MLFLPHDKLPKGRKIYKYALTVVDVASRYKEAEPLTSKESVEVVKAFTNIYKRSSLTWPKLLQVDPGREFMGDINKLMRSKNVQIRRGEKGLHRAQGIVERFNRTLAEKLFSHQYAQEILLESRGKNVRSVEWVARLPSVIKALNNELSRLTGKKPAQAVKLKHVSNTKSSKPVQSKTLLLPPGVKVRYLYQPGELEGGEHRRATDPIWSLNTYEIIRVFNPVFNNNLVIYYLHDPAPKRGFVREELLVVPNDTQLPPSTTLSSGL